MNTAWNAARACLGLMAMSIAFSVAVVAAPIETAPQMTLIRTDTSEPYPFATIVVNHQTYHVTEGDILDGVYIRHIAAGRLMLSNDRVLVAERQTPARDSGVAQVSRTNQH